MATKDTEKLINNQDDFLNEHNLNAVDDFSFLDKTKSFFKTASEKVSNFFYHLSHKYLLTRKFSELSSDDSEVMINLWSRKYKAFWIWICVFIYLASATYLIVILASIWKYYPPIHIVSHLLVTIFFVPAGAFVLLAWYGNSCSYRAQFWIKYVFCKIRLVRKSNWSFYLNDVRVSIACLSDKAHNSMKKYILRETKDLNSLKFHPVFAHYMCKQIYLLHKGPYFENSFASQHFDLSLLPFKTLFKLFLAPKGYWKKIFKTTSFVYFKKATKIKEIINSNPSMIDYHTLADNITKNNNVNVGIVIEEEINNTNIGKEPNFKDKPPKPKNTSSSKQSTTNKPTKKQYNPSRKKNRGGKK